MFQNLKTSKKVSIYFSIFSFVSLIILLIWINIIYFGIWYNNQKTASLYDMNMSYSKYSKDWMNKTNIESFKDYILTKDVLIIPNKWEIICSSSLTLKSKNNIESLNNKIIYQYDNKIFLIFSKNYSEIWEVKIFFDTTPYINSQLIIIKISLFIIFISVILNFFLWELIVRKSLKNLNLIKEYCQNLDLNKNIKTLQIEGSEDDEIKIVAEKLNNALKKIKTQNDNLKQFIADVSHEFKTPLMALNSKNDLLKAKLEKNIIQNKDLSELFEYNKLYIQKLDKILEVLFLITRLKEENINLDLKMVDLNKHISWIIEQRWIKNIKIIWKWIIEIDPVIFDIIIENLINNAIKYWNNKEIIISISEKSLSIKDNWIGINKENIELIFNNFYKENTESEGFWIWLYLVKRLIDIYNWKIDVKSEVWKWSEFIIYFNSNL